MWQSWRLLKAVTLINTHTFLGFSSAVINKGGEKGVGGMLSCFDFLLLKPMLKKRGCARTPGFAPSGCRHHKHMNTGDKYTMDFSGSQGNQQLYSQKKQIVVHQSPVFCCFFHLWSFLSPVCPLSCPASHVHLLLLPPQRLLENKQYEDISAKGSPDQDLHPCCKLSPSQWFP